MKKREKILAGIVAGFVGVFALGFGLRWFMIRPLRAIDAKTAALAGQLRKIKEEKHAFFMAEDELKQSARRTFSDNVELAGAKSSEMLTKTIQASGLKEADFTRLPTGPQRLRGAQEVGWSIQGTGEMPKVIHLIFLLEETGYLHRIESLTLTPVEKSGKVKVSFRYLTLVLDPAPAVQFAVQEPRLPLDGPERKAYDVITTRALFQPFTPPPPPPAPAPAPPPSAPGTSGPGPETFRVVSLSQWEGAPEIHVRDLTRQKTTRYKVGETLAGGEIVMVDYRLLPEPGREPLQSYSRVILKIGGDYWAVEQGATLADKYKIPPERMPPALTRK
jgi:hypothetical protein